MIKIYEYKACSTCKKALKFLDKKGISYEKIAIRDEPPSEKELLFALDKIGELKRLFNVSGQDYRRLNMKEELPKLSNTEALKLLADNGNLIKRPFIIGEDIALVGFKEAEWGELL